MQVQTLSCNHPGEKYSILVLYKNQTVQLQDCIECVKYIQNSKSIQIISGGLTP